MSRKWITALAAMAAAGGLAAAATAVLGDGAELAPRDATTLEVDVSGSNRASAAGIAARASGKTKFSYPSSGVQEVPAEPIVSVDVTNCPKKSKVLNGTFQTDGISILITSHPLGKRGWRLDLLNGASPEPEAYNADFGLVCAKSKK